MFGLISVLLAAGSTSNEPFRPEGVPKDALCQVVSASVRIYHWTLPHEEASKRKVMIFPVVDAWPKEAWGAEVVVTPVPFCCGAKRTLHSWRRSQRVEPIWAGTIRATSSYQLTFQFR